MMQWQYLILKDAKFDFYEWNSLCQRREDPSEASAMFGQMMWDRASFTHFTNFIMNYQISSEKLRVVDYFDRIWKFAIELA